MPPAISVRQVTKIFSPGTQEELLVLKNISFEISPSEIFVLLGPSGSGKSTLLRIMSGLEPAFSGSIALGPGLTRFDTSFVFQQFALLPWLTVAQNVELGLIARQVPEDERRERVQRELAALGLTDFAGAYTRELSGGMAQRVGIARAFITNPKIIFMDEPFSELDSFTAEELRGELLAIWAERKPTIILVTHMIPEAIELGDRIAVLTPRPGRIEGLLPNFLPRPRAKRSSEFYRLEDELSKLIKP